MVGVGDLNKSPKVPENPTKNRQEIVENETLFSPGFRSVAAMAGWDEEALLIASLIVEDTPDRQFKQKKRSVFNSLKTPPTNSRRKRKAQRRSSESKEVPIGVLDLDEDEPKPKLDNEKVSTEEKTNVEVGSAVLDHDAEPRSNLDNFKVSSEEKIDLEKSREDEQVSKEENTNAEVGSTVLDRDKDEPKSKLDNKKVSSEEKTDIEKCREDEKVNAKSSVVVSTSSPAIPCINRLREELSCAICLEICYEPSTTPCGHSFCKKCLRSAADRCGKKCPKCRQLLSNGRYCTVNTVLWNTIQLLFPHEVEARKTPAAAADSASDSRETQSRTRSRAVQASNNRESNNGGAERRRSRSSRAVPSIVTRTELPGQDEDAALALRLQREEFMEAFTAAPDEQRSSITTARANLRAMASRAMNIRIRSRRDF